MADSGDDGEILSEPNSPSANKGEETMGIASRSQSEQQDANAQAPESSSGELRGFDSSPSGADHSNATASPQASTTEAPMETPEKENDQSTDEASPLKASTANDAPVSKKMSFLERLKAMKFAKSKGAVTVDLNIGTQVQKPPRPPPMKETNRRNRDRENRDEGYGRHRERQPPVARYNNWDAPTSEDAYPSPEEDYAMSVPPGPPQPPMWPRASASMSDTRYNDRMFTYNDMPDDEEEHKMTPPPAPAPLSHSELDSRLQDLALEWSDIERLTWNQLKDCVKQLRTRSEKTLSELNENDIEIAKVQQQVQEQRAALKLPPSRLMADQPNKLVPIPGMDAWLKFNQQTGPLANAVGFAAPPPSNILPGLALFKQPEAADLSLFKDSEQPENDAVSASTTLPTSGQVETMSTTQLVGSLISSIMRPPQPPNLFTTRSLERPPPAPLFPPGAAVLSQPKPASDGVVADTTRARVVPADRRPRMQVTLRSRVLKRRAKKPSMLGNKKTRKAKTQGDENQTEEGQVAEGDFDQMTSEAGIEPQEGVHDDAADDVSSPHMEAERTPAGASEAQESQTQSSSNAFSISSLIGDGS